MSGITFCIQCAMEDLLADRAVQMYDESIEDHMAHMHPDPVATQARRKELEKLLAEHIEKRDHTDPRRI